MTEEEKLYLFTLEENIKNWADFHHSNLAKKVESISKEIDSQNKKIEELERPLEEKIAYVTKGMDAMYQKMIGEYQKFEKVITQSERNLEMSKDVIESLAGRLKDMDQQPVIDLIDKLKRMKERLDQNDEIHRIVATAFMYGPD